MIERLAIIGVGLIGSSLALALRWSLWWCRDLCRRLGGLHHACMLPSALSRQVPNTLTVTKFKLCLWLNIWKTHSENGPTIGALEVYARAMIG